MELFGLPLHPLMVHAVVVLVPLIALASIVYALWPRTRRVLTWPILAGIIIALPATLLTKEAGEKLEHAMPRSGLIENHAERGDLAFWGVALLFLAVLFALIATSTELARVPWLAWTTKFQERGWVGKLALVLLGLASIFAIVATVLAGHTGAVAAWTNWKTR